MHICVQCLLYSELIAFSVATFGHFSRHEPVILWWYSGSNLVHMHIMLTVLEVAIYNISPSVSAGKETVSDVAPDSASGKFETFVDSIKDKFAGGNAEASQSTQSVADTPSGSAAEFFRSEGDNISSTVNATTPQELTSAGDSTPSASDSSASTADPLSAVSAAAQSAVPAAEGSNPSSALTAVTDKVSDAASKAAEQVKSLVNPEANQVAVEGTASNWKADDTSTVADAGSAAYIAADTEKPSREVPTEVATTASKAGDAAKDFTGQVCYC